ncbi:hypothetical protein K435DRAFT_800325 [Dendrothele bispora CBS 962.96]|uniref:Uncharacterized protein n=1 Tax=Dendrothele bispora (strain CBS 962.96) TaxID=1314807 RepID=A0A4S8LT03_DENBC|nr:hypothetical protein K435DRAFT_800325 [Dendrothele bispora CBS 962.96]
MPNTRSRRVEEPDTAGQPDPSTPSPSPRGSHIPGASLNAERGTGPGGAVGHGGGRSGGRVVGQGGGRIGGRSGGRGSGRGGERVIPVHTKEECDLFHNAVKTGGKFSPRNGVPDFKSMTSWWSSQADGKKIFYKLFEHFETYYKTYKEYNNTKQSLVASQQQRKPHEDRIKSTLYVSQTLDAANHLHPGILNDPEHLLVDSAGLRHTPQEPIGDLDSSDIQDSTEITPASATFLANDNEILEPFSKRQKLNHMFGVTENEQSLFSNATFAQPNMVMPSQLPTPEPLIMHPASYPNTSSSSVNQATEQVKN